MDIASNYFMINQVNSEKEEEDLSILNNIHHKKPNRGFKIKTYEKFKPKPKIVLEKIDSSLLTAENKVKLLLSSFLHGLKSEQKKEKYNNNNNKNTKLRKKKTKNLNKKPTIPDKKNSSNIIDSETPVFGINKINTISGNNYYKNENKNDLNQPLPTFERRTKSVNSKSLLKKKQQKNFDTDNLMNNNGEKSGLSNRKKSIDINFNYSEDISTNDIEKDHYKNQINSGKKPQKYKKIKPKMKKSSKKSFKPVISSSLYLKFDLDSLIDEKLSKLTGDIREGIAIEEMLKSKNRRSMTNNNNLNYCNSYFNNFLKNSNINYCSNFSDKAKSESSSPKKEFIFKKINKIEKNENITDSPFKRISSKGKVNYNEYIQRAKSYFSRKVFTVNTITKKKNVKIDTLKDLKEKIRNTIILRPEELNLEDDFDINNSQNTIIFNEKEKTQRSKVNFSSDNKNTESNLSNNNKKIDKKVNKNQFDNENETIKNVDDFLDNENQNQKEMSFCSFGKTKTKKEIINENFRILTYKKLVYDSFDDEEIEEENNKYIHPDCLFIKIFDNIIIFFAFSSLIYIPYYLASTGSFCKNYKKLDYVINIFVEIVYLLDFIFGFFKAYYNFEEQLITNNISIIKKYLLSWFLLDLISALPLYSYLKIKEPLCRNHNNIHPYDEKMYNLHYLIILNKLLKIFKVNSINHSFIHLFNKFAVNNSELVQLLILLSGLHFFSCLNIFIGRNSYPNWILESKLENKKFSDLYISSVYSIVASITTVGYGDFICHSSNERIFQVFLLILGCMAYSWFISSFSNYIQKNNEKSADFEKRKQILDEIRINHPVIPKDLYDKVLLYLKYKNCNEKRDIKMIFDCLPIGLKNNLVYEMYKPIVKNFIFFKNFGNTDFIVRVILAFRPILAYKNDILLNEGDMVNDILFVKKGILSLQIPINIKNPEEYIDKYLYGDIFAENNQQNNYFNSGNQNNNFMTSIILQQDYNQMNILNLTEKKDLFYKLKKTEEENERKKNTRYIKILSIRQNEHFGDVLMFLDQRSPLRVKVTSKKAELFFLKKMDVVKISSNYQNIWKRINKRSVYNFEQIKRSIPKIVELYCKFKGFNVNKEDSSKISCIKSPKKNLNRRTLLPTTKLKMSALVVKKPKRSLTQIYNKRNIFTQKYFPSKEDFSYEYKNIKTHIITNRKSILNDSNSNNDDDSDESSGNSNISVNTNNSKTLLNEKLSNIYNRHYKYYIGSKVVEESYKTVESMIKEEPETESSMTSLKTTNIIKNKLLEIAKNSTIINNNIKNSLVKSSSGKINQISKKLFDKINQNKNENNSKRKGSHMEIINEIDETLRKRSKSIRPDIISIKKRRSNNVFESAENENKYSLNLNINSINNEFDINDEIKIPINESLMSRSISKSILLDKNNIIPIQNINNINKENSEKIIYLDKSLNKYSDNLGSILNKSQINNNKLNNSKKFFEKENLIPESIITDIQISSIYNNLNSLNNKYYLNKYLQERVKQLLEENIQINSESNKTVKSTKSIKMNESVTKSLNKSLNNTLINNSDSNNMNINSPLKIYLKSSSLSPKASINKKKFKQEVRSREKRSSTYTELDDKNENSINSSKILKKKRKNLMSNIEDSSPGKSVFRKQNFDSILSPKRRSYMRKSSTKVGFGINENLFSLNKNKNDMMISPNFFNKKKKYNLLSTIDFNIKKNSENINNPNAFYSFYFQSLLEKEKRISKLNMSSKDFSPRCRRSKK